MGGESIRVLHVDDEPDFAALAATFLKHEDERFDVETATGAEEGLDRLAENGFDCVVSDYDMPRTNGIEFLEHVRDEYPDLPFVLLTDGEAEGIASDAIAAGATDALRRRAGTEQYVLLANRVRNAIEQHRTERRARLQGRQYRDFFEQAPVMYVVTRDEGGRLRIEDCNDRFLDRLGYDREAVIDRPISAFYTEDARRKMHEDGGYERALHGDFGTEERTLVAKDGERVHVLNRANPRLDTQGTPVGVQAMYLDITERKRREEAVSALHDATRAFMEAADKGTIAERAVDTARTVLDLPLSGLWLHDSDTDVLRPVAATEEGEALIGDPPTYTGNGSLSWQAFESGELSVYDDLRDEPGRLNPETPIRSEIIVPLGEHGVMNFGSTEPEEFDDIDLSLAQILSNTVEAALSRAERERQLRAQRRELGRQNERLEEFASVVSHDLRNPLNVAEGNLALAREDCDSAHLDDAANALDRMDALIKDILTVATDGTAVETTEPIDLDAVVEACWQHVETGDATLVVDTEQTVHADPGRLQRLLENLIRNAVEHGGTDVTVTVGDLGSDDGWGFYVADDGPGIPEEHRDRVFESGYSTSEGGTGFGLAIVREIAEAHGWEIGLAENDDGGARFEITNPGSNGRQRPAEDR